MVASRRAFTLIELLVVIAIIALLVLILLPALGSARRAARQSLCMANLQQFGRAYGSYANDFKERIGALQGDINDPQVAADHTEHNVVATQVQNLINTFDGRRPTTLTPFQTVNTGGPGAGPSVTEQFEHLALFGNASQDILMPNAVCPEDSARLEWRRNPFNSDSWAQKPVGRFTSANIDWMPYSSSYQLVPAAAGYSIFTWHGTTFSYAQGGSHDTYSLYKVQFGNRKISEVTYPSQKVAMMDSQQRHTGDGDLFYAYPQAQQPLLFWDGSVSIRKTADSNPGWDPSTIRFGMLGNLSRMPVPATKVTYSPDAGFESPKRPELLPSGEKKAFGQYRWTRSGLRGVDFGGSEVNTTVGETAEWQS